MAHQEQRDFFKRLQNVFPDMFEDVFVLEVGSLDINGSIRDFFNANDYIGVDVGPGKGVDLVSKGEDLTFPDGTFDVAVSAECFEHNPAWLKTFQNMIRMSNKYVVFTCASEGRPEHGTRRSDAGSSPHTLDWDYYRNLNEEDFTDNISLSDYFSEYKFEYNPNSKDLYFYGVKH